MVTIEKQEELFYRLRKVSEFALNMAAIFQNEFNDENFNNEQIRMMLYNFDETFIKLKEEVVSCKIETHLFIEEYLKNGMIKGPIPDNLAVRAFRNNKPEIFIPDEDNLPF